MTQFYGWHKDPFNPHALYLKHWALQENTELKILPSVDLRKYTDPLGVPWNQKSKGACTGFGIAVNASARAVEQGVFAKLNQRFSPEFIYDGEREIEGTSGEDAGANPDDGFLWSQQHGFLPEQYDPYTEKLITKPPSPMLDQYAKLWPCTGHFRVDNGVKGLQAALSVGNFVSIGIPYFKKWEDVGSDGVCQDVTLGDEIAGGHEMCLFGYTTIARKLYFIDLQSWGKFGDGGWIYIPASAFEVMKQIPASDGGQYDAHFPRLPWRK